MGVFDNFQEINGKVKVYPEGLLNCVTPMGDK